MKSLKLILLSIAIISIALILVPQALLAMSGSMPPIGPTQDVNGQTYNGTLVLVAKVGGSGCIPTGQEFEIGVYLTLHKNNKAWNFSKVYNEDTYDGDICFGSIDVNLLAIVNDFLDTNVKGSLKNGKFNELYIKEYSHYINTAENVFCTITDDGDIPCDDYEGGLQNWLPEKVILINISIVGK